MFTISGNNIVLTEAGVAFYQTNEPGDEATSMTVTFTDAAGNTSDPVAVAINAQDIDEVAPVASVTPQNFDEDSAAGTTVATISYTDTDNENTAVGSTPTLNNVPQHGGADMFTISGNNIVLTDAGVAFYQTNEPGDEATGMTVTFTDAAGNTSDPVAVAINAQDIDETQAIDNEVTTLEDEGHTFETGDFKFTDQEGSPLTEVRIDSLPTDGTLTFNGEAVTANQVIAADQLSQLVFTPDANESGNDYAQFDYSVNVGDGFKDNASATMTVDVTSVNDAPTISYPGSMDINFESEYAGWSSIVGSYTLDENGNPGNVQFVLYNNNTATSGEHLGQYAPDSHFFIIPKGASSIPADAVVSITSENGEWTMSYTTPGSSTVTNVGTVYYEDSEHNMTNDVEGSDPHQHVFRDGNAGTIIFEDMPGLGDSSYDDIVLSYTMNPEGKLVTTFEEDGQPVAVWSDSVNIADIDDTHLESATVALTNTQDSDELLVNGSDANSGTINGLQWVRTVTTVNGEQVTTITLTGTATPDEYEAAIQAISFNNDSDNPEVGVREIEVTVNDGDDNSSSFTTEITVISDNDQAIAEDSEIETDEDTDYVFEADDFEYTDSEGDELTQIRIDSQPTNGTLLLNGVVVTAGQVIDANNIENLVFRPDANESGDDYAEFDYSVNSGNGFADNASATMTVEVDAVDDKAVATASNVTTDEDTNYGFSSSEFGFTDVEGDGLLQIRIDSLPENGTLTLNGQLVTEGQVIDANHIADLSFEPDENEFGDDYGQFNYSVNSGSGFADNASATMTIDVDPVNDAPDAGDISLRMPTDSDGRITFTAADLLQNSSDIDSANIDITSVSLQGGTPGYNGGGGSSGTYTPPTINIDGNTFHGTSGNDKGNSHSLHGSNYNDRILGYGGDDRLLGYRGDDILEGGDGKDTLYGYSGDDQLLGGSGKDHLFGGEGDDYLDGGTGKDKAYFSGNRSEYTFTLLEDGILRIEDTVDGRDGVDYVKNVEEFRFNDQTTSLQNLKDFAEDGSTTNPDSPITDDDNVISSSDQGWLIDNEDGTYTFVPSDSYDGSNVPLDFTVNDGELSDSAVANLVGVDPVTTDSFDSNVINGDINNDVLIGDVGGVDVGAQAMDHNIVFMLDISTSMHSNNRLANMKEAVVNLLQKAAEYNDVYGDVNVHIVGFSGQILGHNDMTFSGINDSASALQAAIDFVNGLTPPAYGDGTNYEVALQNGIAWLENQEDPNVQQTSHSYFISDGEPNTVQDGDRYEWTRGDYDRVEQELNGTYAGNYNNNSDNTDEFSQIKDICGDNSHAIGIGTSGSLADRFLDQIDSSGDYLAVANPEDLTTSLEGIQPNLVPVGSDIINASGGDDIVFGDSINTDILATEQNVNVPEGSGWKVFEELEQRDDWSREDTINYIRDNHEAMSAEANTDDGTAREGGADTIHGDEGNDILYGQEGNDILFGDDDDDILFGGSGSDTLTGGTGDDDLYGGSLIINDDDTRDVFIFDADGGEGNDDIYGMGDEDVIKFTDVIDEKGDGLTIDDVDVTATAGDNGNLLLTIGEGSDATQITIHDGMSTFSIDSDQDILTQLVNQNALEFER
ncbi:MAG: cadherin-like domain-containing protein [Desulfovibrio sp.]